MNKPEPSPLFNAARLPATLAFPLEKSHFFEDCGDCAGKNRVIFFLHRVGRDAAALP
jgi:hypothetical protein